MLNEWEKAEMQRPVVGLQEMPFLFNYLFSNGGFVDGKDRIKIAL